MMYFIFNSADGSLHLVTSIVNSNFLTDDYLVGTLPEGDEFDPSYMYSHSDGIAVKGVAIAVDTEELARMVAEEVAMRYIAARKTAYPSIGDQLDALFHAGAFPAEMAAQIQSVKDANPKPS